MALSSAFSPLIYAGIYAATISSALGSYVCSPRIFQVDFHLNVKFDITLTYVPIYPHRLCVRTNCSHISTILPKVMVKPMIHVEAIFLRF